MLMKKLLSIIVLFLMFCNTAIANTLIIYCKYEFTSEGEKVVNEDTFEIIDEKVYKDGRLLKRLQKLNVNFFKTKVEFTTKYTGITGKEIISEWKINLKSKKGTNRTRQYNEVGNVTIYECEKIKI